MAERELVLRDGEVLVNGRRHRLNADDSARVETTGSLVTTPGQRPSLRAWLALGPLALVFSRRRSVDDSRRLHLILEGPGWSEMIDGAGVAEVELRLMAQRINAAAHAASS